MLNGHSKRGFGGMDKDKQREIARRGGQEAHRKGTAHEFSVEEARSAGHKGGLQVSQNRSHMAAIGRMGGRRRGQEMAKRRLAADERSGDGAMRAASTAHSASALGSHASL